jgi:hygromycin-B 7''-O-kinase
VSQLTLDVSEAEYRRRFSDPHFGLDLAEVVADRCRLPRPLVRQIEGSNLVFKAGDGLWLKISPPFWIDAFEAELRVTEAVRGRLPARVPSILESGALEDWRYLVSADVPGVQIQKVLPSLAEADLESIAAELGQFMRAFHAVVLPDLERPFGTWARYLNERLANTRDLHLSRGVDPIRVEQITTLLAKREPELRALGPPVLIHADLTDEHIMLVERAGRWRLSGVLDLADAMQAPAALDLISPFVELFRGRRGPQRRLVEECGACVGEGPFSEAVMAVALQHRFVHFDNWFAAEIDAGATDVTDIARAVFPD